MVPFVAAASPLQLRDAQRLQQEGKLQEAIAVLEPLLKSEPDNLEGGSLLAWLYTQTGEVDLAIEEYRRLAHRYPEQADFHNGLGALLFRTRQLDEARREFEMARSLNPGHAVPHFNLGLLSLERGAFSAATA
ncbi:MAG: tetratricopeptide repeat protein [Acidobacteria bacterium]|nr:MAG: tetratricopeptide repeat protein [Acidobacteriota bacterium]